MLTCGQEGIRRILELVTGEKLNRGEPIDTSGIGELRRFPKKNLKKNC